MRPASSPVVSEVLLLSPVVVAVLHTTTRAMVGSRRHRGRTPVACRAEPPAVVVWLAGIQMTAASVVAVVVTPETVRQTTDTLPTRAAETPTVDVRIRTVAQAAPPPCVAQVATAAGASPVEAWPAMVVAAAEDIRAVLGVNTVTTRTILAPAVAAEVHSSVQQLCHPA